MNNELVMDLRVVWNSNHLKQIDEAKAKVIHYLKKGYQIVTVSGEKVEKFRPALEEVIIKAEKIVGKRVLKILNEKGDERLVWNKDNGKEAMDAKKKFLEFVKKGHTAYSLDATGQKKRKITEFDVDSEEILMVPETAKG